MKNYRSVIAAALVLASALWAYAGDVRISALVEEENANPTFWEMVVGWFS